MSSEPHHASANLPVPHRPVVALLILAAPTAAQMASYPLMQFIDTWMLSKLGVSEPTAAGNSGLFAFAMISLGMGVLWVVNTMVSQNFGQRDYPTCGRYLWQGLWFSLGYSVLLLPMVPLAGPLFLAQGHDAHLAGLEGTYMGILLSFTLVKLIGATFGQFLLAINRPGNVLTATACGLTVNIIAAGVLIFGVFGTPRLGIAGAAWGQNIGVAVETTVLITFSLRNQVRRAFGVSDWRPRLKEMKTLLAVGIPSGVQVVSDVLAWAIFSSYVLNKFGEAAMAANTFMMRYMSVSFMPAFGIATAVTALVGRSIGMGRPELARRYANLGFAITGVYMVTCGVGFFIGRHHLIALFTQEATVLSIGAMLLVYAAIYQIFDAMYIVYNGALRGAGDTLMPAVATACLNWGITVTGGYLVARYAPQFGAAGPWTAATLYGILLGVFMLWRFRRSDWETIALEDDSPSAKVSPLQSGPQPLNPSTKP